MVRSYSDVAAIGGIVGTVQTTEPLIIRSGQESEAYISDSEITGS